MHSMDTPRDPRVLEEAVGLLSLRGETSHLPSGQKTERCSLSSEPRSLVEEMTFFDMEKQPRRSLIQRIVPWIIYQISIIIGLCRATSISHILLRLIKFLIPSFLHGPEARAQIRPAKIHPTAYLDGMRGLAALAVFFCHYLLQAYTVFFGFGRGGKDYNVFRLPIVRLMADGSSAVSLFFVISGYALSYKPLRLIRAGNYHEFSVTMSSMTFRRAIRLYLPTAISTFMILCLAQMGAYELTRPFASSASYQPLITAYHVRPLPTFWKQICDWAWKMWKFVHVFGWDKVSARIDYDVHLWTIPVEFRCSLYLFLVILGTARLRTLSRYLVLAGCMFFTLRHDRWELVLFMFGMGIAEFDHIQGLHLPNVRRDPSGRARYLWISLSVIGLYFLSQPSSLDITPGWRWLGRLIPDWMADKDSWYKIWGAAIFVLSVGRLPGWQKFFNSFPVQYLGKISYALYLMHGPSIHLIGYHFEKWALDISGVKEYYNYGYALAACFTIPFTIWWADVFWRAVDIPTVKFAKWLETQLVAKHD